MKTNSRLIGVGVRRLVLALRGWRRKHLRTMDEVVTDMVYGFREEFPGKCMICSFHRYGRDHGMTLEPEPAPHDCIDRQNVQGDGSPDTNTQPTR